MAFKNNKRIRFNEEFSPLIVIRKKCEAKSSILTAPKVCLSCKTYALLLEFYLRWESKQTLPTLWYSALWGPWTQSSPAGVALVISHCPSSLWAAAVLKSQCHVEQTRDRSTLSTSLQSRCHYLWEEWYTCALENNYINSRKLAKSLLFVCLLVNL